MSPASGLLASPAAVPNAYRHQALREIDGHRRARRTRSTGASAGHVPRRAGADPDDLVQQQLALEQDALDVRRRERRDGARLEAGGGDDLLGLAIRA